MVDDNHPKKSEPIPVGQNSTQRSDVYRYAFDVQKSDLTPLAHVEAHLGQFALRVLNISQGGVALLSEEPSKHQIGDRLDLSIAIREKHFPVQVEIKNIISKRLSCAFLDPAPNLQQALKEFLKSKYLGNTLKKNSDLSKDPFNLGLVPGSHKLEVFAGENQTGVFVWMGHDREIKKFLMVTGDLAIEWTLATGLRTGRQSLATRPEEGSEDSFVWDRQSSEVVVHHFADILLAWMDITTGPEFVRNLSTEGFEFKFPILN